MIAEPMKVYIDKIEPRENHDAPVMNVEVLFVVPVEDNRFVHVRVTVFVDKGAKTMDEVRRSAIDTGPPSIMSSATVITMNRLIRRTIRSKRLSDRGAETTPAFCAIEFI